MHNKIFQVHGSYRVEFAKDYVFVVVEGAWNKEAMESLVAVVDNFIDQKQVDQFAILADFSNWELGTPEFEEKLKQARTKHFSKGLRCEALVMGEGATKRFQVNKVIQESGIDTPEVKLFDIILPAKEWLRERGFKVT